MKVLTRSFPPSKWNKLFGACYSKEATFDTKAYDLYKLDKGPKTSVKVTEEEALNYYRQMQLIRRLEITTGTMYRNAIIRGFCHLYMGQEAIAVGVRAAMRTNDMLISSYRIHGWAYVMGETIEKILSELVGCKTGSSRGKGGSMHMYNENFYGGQGIVGAQVSLGAGLAFMCKYTNSNRVAFALYGDGAANQGQIFEVFNMAQLWSLPCIFLCENNGYGMGTSAERSSANIQYYKRGDFIPGLKVDGMDVLAVKESTEFAVNYTISGKGPIIIEMVTYRYSGHSVADSGASYRKKEEVEDMRKKADPIMTFRNKILKAGLIEEIKLQELDKQIKTDIENALKKALAEKEVDPEELTADIYAEPLEPKIRNVLHNEGLGHRRIGKAKNK